MAKKQKIDKLAQEVSMAFDAGMSYGKWKAMQDPVMYEKPTDCELVVCKYCGKQFKPKVKKRQIYCDIYCQKKAQYAARRKRLLGSASASALVGDGNQPVPGVTGG